MLPKVHIVRRFAARTEVRSHGLHSSHCLLPQCHPASSPEMLFKAPHLKPIGPVLSLCGWERKMKLYCIGGEDVPPPFLFLIPLVVNMSWEIIKNWVSCARFQLKRQKMWSLCAPASIQECSAGWVLRASALCPTDKHGFTRLRLLKLPYLSKSRT